MNNNEAAARIVGLCYKGSESKKKVHKIHIQSDNPRFLRAWVKSIKKIEHYPDLDGWMKKRLIIEGSEITVLGMIRSDRPSGRKYLDIWIGQRSLFVKKLLEAELTKGKKNYSTNGLCPECFEKYLEKNHIRKGG